MKSSCSSSTHRRELEQIKLKNIQNCPKEEEEGRKRKKERKDDYENNDLISTRIAVVFTIN